MKIAKQARSRPMDYLLFPSQDMIDRAMAGFSPEGMAEQSRLMDLEDGHPEAVRVRMVKVGDRYDFDLVAPWGLSVQMRRALIALAG